MLRVAGFSCRATQTHRRTDELPPVPPVRHPDAGHGATYLPLLDSNLLLLFLLLILLFFFLMLFFFGVVIFPPCHCEFEKINVFLLS